MARNDKYSYNKITSFETDWDRDPTNGKHYAGEVVQEFIKEQVVIAQTKGDHAEEQGDYAKQQGDYAKEWNDHPPYVGDGTTGDKNYWYLYDITTQQYVKGPYAKGDDIDWNTMTDEEYERLVENVKADLVDASVQTCEDIVDELS